MVIKSVSTAMSNMIPDRVESVRNFLQQHNLWFVLSRNDHSTSCREAASRRYRLGKQGIPVYDELKSLAFTASFNGRQQHVFIHCRANVSFSMPAVAACLAINSKDLQPLSVDELQFHFAAQYGTVNPFFVDKRVIHLFDEDVLRDYTSPHTMMTNAGDLTWAIEFRPVELIAALQDVSAKVIVAPIVSYTGQHRILPSFGIITGNGPESGMSLWSHLNQKIRSEIEQLNMLQGDLSYPRVLIHSIPEMGLSMELQQREAAVWQVIDEAVGQLAIGKVSHITLACNTTPYFTDRIRTQCQQHNMEFVSIAEQTINYIRRYHLNSISIMGIPIVSQLGSYSAYQELAGLGVKPVKDKVMDDLQELGYLIKRMETKGQDTKAMNKLRHIIRSGVETERILIALTEISVLLERFPRLKNNIGGKEVINPLAILGDTLADIYIQSLPSMEVLDEPEWV